MLVVNKNEGQLILSELDAKTFKGNVYFIVGQMYGGTHSYIIRQVGQRSWGAFALSNVKMDLVHISGNSGSIVENVTSLFAESEVYRVRTDNDALTRKVIMELQIAGTIGKNNFDATLA